MTTMVYKAGGKHKLHGLMCDYIITEDVDAALADGWALTPAAAHEEAPEADDLISGMSGKELAEALKQHGIEDVPRKVEDRRAMLLKIVLIDDEELK